MNEHLAICFLLLMIAAILPKPKPPRIEIHKLCQTKDGRNKLRKAFNLELE